MMTRLVPLVAAGTLLAVLGAGCSDPGKTADPAAGIPKLDQRARALPPPETACTVPPPAQGAATGALAPRCAIAFGRAVGALVVATEGSPAVVSLIHAATASWTLPTMSYATAFAPLPAEREARAGVASAARDRAVLGVGSELIGYALSTGQVVGRADGPGGTINDLAWTGDGAWMVVAAGGKASVLDAGGKVVRPLPVDGSALHVAVSPDGAHTAVANDVGAITLFGTGDAAPRTIAPSLQPVEGLAFAGDLLWVAGSDGTLRAFDVASAGEKTRLDVGTPLTRLALSADGRRAAVAGRDRSIRTYSLPDGAAGATLAWHEAQITGLAWGAGTTLVSGDGDGKLAVWDVAGATR
jgi:hypothetical protein